MRGAFDRTMVVRSCRSEEHTSELQSQFHLVCRLLLEKTNLALDQFLLVYGVGDHRDLHSFPTRRSSDLVCAVVDLPGAVQIRSGCRYIRLYIAVIRRRTGKRCAKAGWHAWGF